MTEPIYETWIKNADTPEDILKLANGFIAKLYTEGRKLSSMSIWGEDGGYVARLTFVS